MIKEKKDILNRIICIDVLDGLKNIPDDTVHLCFNSPPYNTLERSGAYTNNRDNIPYADYLNWLKDVFTLVYAKTVSGGRCAINIDATTNRQDDNDKEYVRCIYAHLYEIMKNIGWLFRTEICWLKSEAVGKKSAWGSWMSASNPTIRRNHEYVLVWSKDKWKLDSDVDSDLTREEFEQYTLSTWDVMAETRKMADHPAPFSEALVKRVIKLFSFPNQVVLDPFSGTGTTPYVAKLYNRNYIGIDNSKKYCRYARSRIKSIKDDQQSQIFDVKHGRLAKGQVSKDRKLETKEEGTGFSWENKI